jgi:hypothetical protein
MRIYGDHAFGDKAGHPPQNHPELLTPTSLELPFLGSRLFHSLPRLSSSARATRTLDNWDTFVNSLALHFWEEFHCQSQISESVNPESRPLGPLA